MPWSTGSEPYDRAETADVWRECARCPRTTATCTQVVLKCFVGDMENYGKLWKIWKIMEIMEFQNLKVWKLWKIQNYGKRFSTGKVKATFSTVRSSLAAHWSLASRKLLTHRIHFEYIFYTIPKLWKIMEIMEFVEIQNCSVRKLWKIQNYGK